MPDFTIGFVLFPNLTLLDLVGPLQILSRVPGTKTHVIAQSYDPVPSDCGLSQVPTATFADSPALDMICVPGGYGVSQAIVNDELMSYVKRQSEGAQYVTSVCTGAFVLGVAGLLNGRRVTTHWAYTHLLPLVGATFEKARVVKDQNVFTGGGVTAGIDFGLRIAAELADPDVAQNIQLSVEYNPEPPFSAGSPDSAPAEIRDRSSAVYEKRTNQFRSELESALGHSALR